MCAMKKIMAISILIATLSIGRTSAQSTDDRVAYVPRNAPARTADDLRINFLEPVVPGEIELGLPEGTYRLDLFHTGGKGVEISTSAERHPTRLAIEPVAEHRLFFFVRQGHPLASVTPQSLETILVFPVVAPRLPQRIGGHIVKSLPQARIDRETGDLLPNLLLDTFAVARNLVLAGDAVGLAPLGALESDLRTRRLALVAFSAPWLNLNYGLFYPRKRSLSRVAQLFMTQLRQVEAVIQAREQRALSRLSERKRPRRTATRKAAARSARKVGAQGGPTTNSTSNNRTRRTRK